MLKGTSKRIKNGKEESLTIPNQIELQLRYETVYKMIINGKTRFDVIKFCKENYGIVEGTADVYIGKAREIMSKNIPEKINDIRDESLNNYKELYQKCIEEKKYREAKEIQSRIDKICGLDVEQVKIEGSIDINNILKEIIESDKE